MHNFSRHSLTNHTVIMLDAMVDGIIVFSENAPRPLPNWIINVCYLHFTQWIFKDYAKQQQNASLVLLINDICAELCRT